MDAAHHVLKIVFVAVFVAALALRPNLAAVFAYLLGVNDELCVVYSGSTF